MNGIAGKMLPARPPIVVKQDLLATMAACGEAWEIPANEVFIREGEPSFNIYILLSGRVKVFGTAENGREVIYNILGPGEFLGEMCLDGGTRSASVATLEPTSCRVVSSDDLRDFIAAYPDFAMSLVHKLIQRVRHSTDYIKSLALDDVYHRTSRLLQSLAICEGGRLITADPITQKDIADRVGATREMINRIFRQLILGGYVAKEGRRIVLLKPLPQRW